MNTISTEPTLQDVGEVYEQQMLDAELRELPEKYREPLVLHYLQGLSNRQVADRLDVSVPCVEGRLKRGKKELRLRLTRRGLGLGAALTAVHLTSAAAQAGALESLITSTAHIAASQTLTSSTATAVASEAAAQLATKEIAMLASAKTSILVSSVAAAVITIGVVAGVNSSTQSAHADAPLGTSSTTPLIDSQLDTSLAPSVGALQIAQADADDSLEADTQDLQRAIQDLRDELTVLQAELDDRNAQQQLQREDELGNLREDLADLYAGTGGAAPGTPASPQERYETFDFSESDPQTQQIKTALEESIDIEFPGNPLGDVLDYISQVQNIPILLDELRVVDAGISRDEEVSLMIAGVTLENALDIMLNNISGVELDYIVENQVLMITTAEHAASVMETRVYSLNQLPADYRPEEIARVIIRTIAPETWRNSVVPAAGGAGFGGMMGAGMDMEEMYGDMGMEQMEPVGGPGTGSLEPLPGVLVVTQSQRVHRQIVDLLSQLKRQHEVMAATTDHGGMMEDYGIDEYEGGGDDFGASGFSGESADDFGFDGGDLDNNAFGSEEDEFGESTSAR